MFDTGLKMSLRALDQYNAGAHLIFEKILFHFYFEQKVCKKSQFQ